MKKIFILVAVLLIFSGCGKKVRIISQDDMIKILADMHLADAVIDQSKYKKFRGYDTVIYQEYILEKYGYEREEFDSTIAYYSRNIEDLKEIYEKVIEVLQHQQTALVDDFVDTVKVKDTIADNLWSLKDNWELPQDGERDNIEFEFPLKGKGRYTLTVDIKLYQDDQSENPRINVFFYKKMFRHNFGRRKYFKSVLLEKDEVLTTHTLSEEISDTLYTHIKGQILGHTNIDNENWKKHAEVKNIRLFFEPSDTTGGK